MASVNRSYRLLNNKFIFDSVASRVAAYQKLHPNKKIIPLGIGDTALPLVPTITDAIHSAADEMADKERFKGYSPIQGYDFLRRSILEHDFHARGMELDIDDIFISEGIQSDITNILEIFSPESVVGVMDPSYPCYLEATVMSGRAGEQRGGLWSDVVYLKSSVENNFLPQIPSEVVDVIYLCSPNNPTGVIFDRCELERWVSYAKCNNSIILFDVAYGEFITDPLAPRSIYEIKGAKEVAIEFRTYSKMAGFTGIRCGYTVIPKELAINHTTENGSTEKASLNKLWLRRLCSKHGGVSFISQRAAEAIYSPKGREEIERNMAFYLKNAERLFIAFKRLGFEVYGGVNSPFIWIKMRDGLTSWDLFDRLLSDCQITGTPGHCFGPSGVGYLRISSFAKALDVEEAIQRLKAWKIDK